jgi:hypothetical protein
VSALPAGAASADAERRKDMKAMELNEFTVRELADRVGAFAGTWNDAGRTAFITGRLDAARAPFTVNGIDATPEDVLDAHAAKAGEDWGKDARAAALTTELDLDGALAVLDDRIASAKVLRPSLEPLASEAARQLEEIAGFLYDDQQRRRWATATRAEAVSAYEAADERTQSGRRLAAWFETQWQTIPFRADDADAADAAVKWQRVREARQTARVPKELFQWRAALVQARRSINFEMAIRFIREGAGLGLRRVG